MSLAVLGLAYLGAGVIAAAALALARRLPAADALLVVGLWPLWAPFVLSRTHVIDGAERIRAATARLAELEHLPPLDAADLDDAGDVAALRHRTLERLHAVRAQYRAELADIQQLLALARVAADPEVERELAARVDGLAAIEPEAREYAPRARR